jgi:hypothetical protein
MAAIAINDLPASRLLDGKAMSAIRGGVFNPIGAFTPFRRDTGIVPFVNFYQTNVFVADVMQFQIVDIDNSAPNSDISVVLDEDAKIVKS